MGKSIVNSPREIIVKRFAIFIFDLLDQSFIDLLA